MAEWFSSWATQAIEFADNIADSLVAQAAEAQEQIVKEQQQLQREKLARDRQLNSSCLMPWESEDESLAILSQDLMEKIFLLSLNDSNFTTEPANSADVHFDLNDFTATAMRLLQLDTNLARAHSKISPMMDETVFWRNYYCRIAYLRAASGIEGAAVQEENKKWEDAAVVHLPQVEKPSMGKRESALSQDDPTLATPTQHETELVDGKQKKKGAESAAVAEVTEGRDENGEDEIDLSDMDDLLDDMIGDMDAEDFEEIGKSEYTGTTSNDELEAQIAQELAEDDD